jgi:hypothetical protein
MLFGSHCWYVLFTCMSPYVSMGIAALYVKYREVNDLKIRFDGDDCNAHTYICVLESGCKAACILFVTSVEFNYNFKHI